MPDTSGSPYTLPVDYDERVYAGVLGKLIGVYLGRPIEGWSHASIAARWGVINRYVHEDQGLPLIVSDDDITGTFTFLRALLDHEGGARITSRQIGQTWLNYIAEGRHILWWGGIGLSAEHTAFLRLSSGVEAPRSGSSVLNGTAVAEEIGAQIFIDGWALVSPNAPAQAAYLACEAARVSHDGEAVHGAVLLAVMESLAFGENDINRLLDGGLAFVPSGSEVSRMVADIRRWHAEDGDWRVSLRRLHEHWGYERYGTNCPLVPNLAVIILALLYGAGDFDRSLMIVNTAGYDTDCNSGNLGCLLGIRGGLATLRSGYDWRTPVNDRLLLPAADGHWGMMDAARLGKIVANLGRRLVGHPVPPSGGARRYDFPFPGSTHGFMPTERCPRALRLEPVPGGLKLRVFAPGLRCDAEVPTFVTPSVNKLALYGAFATPALYSGQLIRMRVEAGKNAGPVNVRIFIRAYQGDDTLAFHEQKNAGKLVAGATADLTWLAPDVGGWPIATVGLSVEGAEGSEVILRSLTWEGLPAIVFTRPVGTDTHAGLPIPWSRAFISRLDGFHSIPSSPFILNQNRGRGLLHTGGEEWRDYELAAELTPMLAAECGLAVRVRGLSSFYALLLRPQGRVVLVRRRHDEQVLAETELAWALRKPLRLSLSVYGSRLRAKVDDRDLFDVDDPAPGLEQGGIGLVITEGRLFAGPLTLTPLEA